MTTPAAAEECILQVYQEEKTSLGRPPTLSELFAIVGCSRQTINLYCAKHSLPLTDGRAIRFHKPDPANT